MNILKAVSAATALVLSTSVNADLISYNGYTLDTDTNIVAGGGLEWLQWDETAGLSINDALASNSGWRLATTAEVESLLNDFNYFGGTPPSSGFMNFTAAPNTTDVLNFIELFGDSHLTPAASSITDFYFEQEAVAAFASDIPDTYNSVALSYYGDGRVQAVGEHLLSTFEYAFSGADSTGGLRGVALVQTSVVPVPAAVWLFGSGLLGLVGVARRKKAA